MTCMVAVCVKIVFGNSDCSLAQAILIARLQGWENVSVIVFLEL